MGVPKHAIGFLHSGDRETIQGRDSGTEQELLCVLEAVVRGVVMSGTPGLNHSLS